VQPERIDSGINYQPVNDKCAGCGNVSCRTRETQGTLRTPTGTSTLASCHSLRRRSDESFRNYSRRSALPQLHSRREVTKSRMDVCTKKEADTRLAPIF
jgi:hypothetical protein